MRNLHMIALFWSVQAACAGYAAGTADVPLRLLPYPQQVELHTGQIAVGPAGYVTDGVASRTEEIAMQSLDGYLPHAGDPLTVRLGSVEEGFAAEWLSADEQAFLARPATSADASVLKISSAGVTVVGKGKWGMLYGVQTVNQLVRGTQMVQGRWVPSATLPCLTIRDWPDMKWRCLSPQMTWYSGYNRLEGYDTGNWTLDEWKWLVDWSLLSKCNGWALCMYGNWPFTLPGYEETTLDVESFYYDTKTGTKRPHRFVHRNIQSEFLPELIRYANERGVKVYAYIGKNTFNGTYSLKHPDANAGGAAELIPFHPGVHEYWEAFIRRILEIGFNGFVFEDPEAMHVPNQNAQCYETFWAPWAETYGFHSVAETDQNKPPLGVHVEYYTWLFREFDDLIRKHTRPGRDPEVYLISHVLLSRMVSESRTQAERDQWFAYIDRKQGRPVPFIIFEADEAKYVSFLGGDRVASLGGRGGSCTNAMRRIASINNNWCYGPMGGDLAYERQCQRNIFEAGGFGAMGYIFEWTNTEVFGYLAAQYLWRNAGVPGIDNENQTGFLNYAYRHHYGDEVGALVARVMDESSCVNDAMMLDGVYGSQFPSTGAPLHRDYQFLAVQADRAVELAARAYRLHAGREPALDEPVYRQDDFRWDGADAGANERFLAERLRLLYVSTRRSQAMCISVLAHRRAQRLAAAGAPVRDVLEQFSQAIDAAELNQLIYQRNYDDDYDGTDGLCARVTETMQAERDDFISSVSSARHIVHAWEFEQPDDSQGWSETHEMTPPTVAGGCLASQATGTGPFVIQTQTLALAVDEQCGVEIELATDHDGLIRLFWATAADLAAQPQDAYPFSESRVRNATVRAGETCRIYRFRPNWSGTLAKLRLDVPAAAKVRIDAIRLVEVPEHAALSPADLARSVPDRVGRSVASPLFIPCEKQTDIVPARNAATPGLYLSVDVGCDARYDHFRLAVVFTVEARATPDGNWQTIFRRAVDRRAAAWEHWDIPLSGLVTSDDNMTLRFVTDSYSRAQDPNAPSWKWALWGAPQIVAIAPDGSRRVRYDCIENIGRARALVRLDRDGRDREFDHPWRDSTGATFKTVEPGVLDRARAEAPGDWQWIDGFAEWAAPPPQLGAYRCYLGTVDSGWVYAHQDSEVAWLTAPIREARTTAVAFVGGTGYGAGKAELWCDGRQLLQFDTASPADAQWTRDGVQLRYLHGGDTRSETIPFGISGVYVLQLPASHVTPGKPLKLAVHVPAAGGGDWFMVHAYRDVLAATREAALPGEAKPAIAAFTPHANGQFGVTIAEYTVKLRQ